MTSFRDELFKMKNALLKIGSAQSFRVETACGKPFYESDIGERSPVLSDGDQFYVGIGFCIVCIGAESEVCKAEKFFSQRGDFRF